MCATCGFCCRTARGSERVSLDSQYCLNLQNDCYGVSTESGSDRVTILAISILTLSGDPVASTTPRGLPAWGPRSALGTDLILKLRHYVRVRFIDLLPTQK